MRSRPTSCPPRAKVWCSPCQVTPFKFGNMKVALDVTLVVLSVAAGFIFLGRLEGVREGTVAAALLVGQVSKIFSRYLVGLRKKLGTEVD